MTKSFPFIHQLSTFDCGYSSLKTILKYYNIHYNNSSFDSDTISSNGISVEHIKKIAESQFNLDCLIAKTNFNKLKQNARTPFIAHWNQNHYVVVYKITKKRVFVADPAFGKTKYSYEEFLKGWSNNEKEGIVLLIEKPNQKTIHSVSSKKKDSKNNFLKLGKYLSFYKFSISQLILGLFLGSIIQFIFPFLTKTIVDFGIKESRPKFLIYLLFLQLVLFILYTAVEFLRAHILIHISSRINIFVISDFLTKVMKLPINFFSHKITGDLVQRIQDNSRIERFITNSLLNSIFSVFSLITFSIILFIFSWKIFLIFFIGITMEVIWIFYFLKKIEILDHKNFALLSEDQDKIYEIIKGILDIKLYNNEKKKLWEWERIQINLFDISLKKLKLDQVQRGGQRFFSYLQLVLITLFSAFLTIQGNLTLGGFITVIFILGQLNIPIGNLINFVLQGQLAKLSYNRLLDIHNKKDEDEGINLVETDEFSFNNDITLNSLNFSYNHSGVNVLQNINTTIKRNEVTAIVGISGSGKTTLLKILLKFLSPNTGCVNLGEINIKNIEGKKWRENFGVVLQDSYIFSDTIEDNIAFNNEDKIDSKKLKKAAEIANIDNFIESLPLKYKTKIGQHGVGLSQGQKQRILIARAVYKDPKILIFDEATNSLDAENEKVIINNLSEFYKGKTVVIVAHRLSTVKNSDNIIVLDRGNITEEGSHDELIIKKGRYYNLIKNQLELGL
ncbi:MAG: ABC transporter ATP-binding protein [Flavobacteriales bacterium]|nr:MAG: ABC transporter ATP-binding protein [Flavobacteriales bacterium]